MTTDLSTEVGEPDPTVRDPRRRRATLIAVCVALMAVIASVTGLNVAQPELAVAFDASQTQVLWFINVYTLSLAALLLPLGAAGDRWGRKPVLLTGLAVFGAASVIAGLATSSEVMLGSRLLAGVGAAMIMPVTLAVITSTFPDQERSKAIGVWTGVAGGGGILGMYLSALLVDLASWRWLFALPVALVAVAVAMTVRTVPNSRETSRHHFDTVGSLTSVVAVVGLIFVLHEGPERGWAAPRPWPPCSSGSRPRSGSWPGNCGSGPRCSTCACSASAGSPAARPRSWPSSASRPGSSWSCSCTSMPCSAGPGSAPRWRSCRRRC
ncbi:hypothetical protein GCM10029992_48720 [Glycomyces albus]